MHRIDLDHSTLESIDLSRLINRSFNCTSVCVMKSGEVIIAGFDNSVNAECYLFCPYSKSCIRLPDLNTPRYYITLLYYDRNAYAFGG